MFHARDDWAAAAALKPWPSPAFGRRAEHAALTVDLAADVLSRDWWRGAGVLAMLCATALALAPGFEPLAGGRIAGAEDDLQSDALAIAPLADGGSTGLRLVESDAVEPLTSAPARTSLDLFMTLGSKDSLGSLLVRAGASYADARTADELIRGSGARTAPGTIVAVTLGARGGGGARPVEKASLRGGLGETLAIERRDGQLALVRQAVAIDARPLRIRGRVGDGLYWSLRAAGVTTQAATEYLRALATRIDVGETLPADRFELVIANRRAATGESQAGPLLYAGLDRAAGSDLQLVRWTVGGRTDWFDANADVEQSASAMMWPVAAPITSYFGMRFHPILRFARMHSGIDFGASRGTPVYAAADGQVSRAGWAGGYGRQVRLVHGGGLGTSYSHLSQIVAEDGALVHKGQLIGYSGSSGLSTGPHLHYEVYRGGVAVNPLSVRFAGPVQVDSKVRDAVKARVRQLLGRS
jgi:murein DD-endopeptidase MepM/ murein hydrolase activator NlpD